MQADQHVAFDRYRVELASFSCSGHTWLPSPSLATCPHSINCGLFIGDAAFSLHPIVTIPHNLLDLFSRHILENCRYLFNSAASSGIELWKPGLPVGAGLFVLAQEEMCVFRKKVFPLTFHRLKDRLFCLPGRKNDTGEYVACLPPFASHHPSLDP